MASPASKTKIEKIKTALLGTSGVGKTCIANRFIKNEYNEYINATVGANYQQKLITRVQCLL